MPPDVPQSMVAATLARAQEEAQFLAVTASLLQHRIASLQIELRRLEAQLKSIEYTHWTDEDSPKGETVPGVRHRRLAQLDTQGLMFIKTPIGDQTLHIPWLPKPGGTP